MMIDEDFKEFRNKITKSCDKRNRLKCLKNPLGSRYIFRECRKKKIKRIKLCKESVFEHLINRINELFADRLFELGEIKLPYNMGTINIQEVVKYTGPDVSKKRLNYGVDWGETLRLWYKDEEACKNKVLVRYTNLKKKNKFYYYPGKHKNKLYTTFLFIRPMYNRLGILTEQGKVQGIIERNKYGDMGKYDYSRKK